MNRNPEQKATTGITVFVLPAQEDIAAFQAGKKPNNLLVRQFANEAELSAYKQGLESIEDECDEIDGLSVVGCTVSFTRETDENDDADITEFVFATTAEAIACREGVSDAEGMHAPLVVEPDDTGYARLAGYEAELEMPAILHLPSCDGHGEYDLFVFAPAGMEQDEAVRIVNAEIGRATAEDARNCDKGGEGCDDGLCVEDSIKTNLTKQGFVFVKPRMTYCWDEQP